MDFESYLKEIERLRPEGAGPESLVVLPTVDSTNRLARAIVDEYAVEEQAPLSVLILALEQTAGRGRLGRIWASAAGKGVYASRIVVVEEASLLQTLPLLVGVGLCRALDPFLPSPCRLKWPNDLMVEVSGERRKLGGILIEAVTRPDAAVAVVGFGVNHSQEADDLPENGTSVRRLGGDVSLAELTWSLVRGVERELVHLGDTALAVRAWRERSIHRPGERLSCRTADGTVEGTFAGIDERGRLVLGTEEGERRLSSGEVL